MIINLDIPDIVVACRAINNASAAYARLISMIRVGVEIPEEFHKLYKYSEEDLKEHLLLLQDIVMQFDEEILKL